MQGIDIEDIIRQTVKEYRKQESANAATWLEYGAAGVMAIAAVATIAYLAVLFAK
jgi:hypothetical protein